MTDYENPMEVGLYREETGLVCAGGQITVSAPVAQYIHAKFQNKPTGDDVFTKGVEWLRNTTDSTWNAPDITAVSGKTLTIGAGHNGDSFNIGYYAKGTSVAEANQAIQDDDKWRPEHLDSIYSAMNLKGNINPTECGYVYDQCMGYRSMPAISSTEVDGVYKQEENTTGTWSFTNYHPYYVTSVRVGVDESAIQTGKGIKIHVYESGQEIVETAGSAGLILNDSSGWYASEHDDTVDVWYQANIYLGMLLTDSFRVKIETNGGNTDLSAGDCHIFVSGWHIPDPVNELEGLINDFSQDYEGTTNLGMYRVEGQALDSELKVRFADENIALYHDESMRTHPHFRNEFVNGVEYCKNLTTDEFITGGITSMDYRDIHFSDAYASEGDIVEVGYYSVTEFPTKLCMAAGDLMERGDVDGVIAGMGRIDRVDFGATNFPFGDGEYEWAPDLFNHVELGSVDAGGLDITNGWRTLLHFDSVAYESREFNDWHFTTRTSYNETPFFVSGIAIFMDADAVSGASNTFDRIVLRIMINGSPVYQYGEREVYYIPLAQASQYSVAPSPMGTSTDAAADGAGHMFYIPLGLVRCYGFKVDAKVEGIEAFQTVTYRMAQVEGWIPDDGA